MKSKFSTELVGMPDLLIFGSGLLSLFFLFLARGRLGGLAPTAHLLWLTAAVFVVRAMWGGGSAALAIVPGLMGGTGATSVWRV